MEEKRRFKAEIGGKEYVIMGQRSAQHLSMVVDIINLQLEQLGEIDPELSSADRSILMAINAVSDQLAKEQKIAELEAEIIHLHSKFPKKLPKSTENETNSSGETEQLNKRVPFERDHR